MFLETEALAFVNTASLEDGDLYDKDENYLSYDDNFDGISRIGYDSSLPACLYSDDGSTYFSCDGKCTEFRWDAPANPRVVRVEPNGSYIRLSSNVLESDNTSGDITMICSADGRWRACAGYKDDSGNYNLGLLDSDITIRVRCGDTGYDVIKLTSDIAWSQVNSLSNLGIVDIYDSFCYAPTVRLIDSISTYAPRSCAVSNTSGGYAYSHSACSAGYYLKTLTSADEPDTGTRCNSCPMVTNGTASTTEYNTSTSCSITCNTGYVSFGQECVELDNAGYNPGNYGGDECDTDCPSCPDNALCDGQYVYCPAGNYVYTEYDGTASCRDCPGEWGMAYNSYNSALEDCSGVSDSNPGYEWGRGYADTTDCLWTQDYGSYDSDYCVESMGSDDTGSYEYRYDDGSWDTCSYEE